MPIVGELVVGFSGACWTVAPGDIVVCGRERGFLGSGKGAVVPERAVSASRRSSPCGRRPGRHLPLPGVRCGRTTVLVFGHSKRRAMP